MGNKQNSEGLKKVKSDLSVAGSFDLTRNTASGNDDKKLSEFQRKRLREEKEKELCDQVIREKNSIFQTNLKVKTATQLAAGTKKSAWDEMEKLQFNDATKAINLSSCNLSNSKVFERFCGNLPLAKNLEELNLSDCSLLMLPKPMPDSIKTLKLKENLITVITLPLPMNLEHLDLSYNKIKALPVGMGGKLDYIDLHNNCIDSITNDSLIVLNSLQYLNLSGNQLTEIKFTMKVFSCLYTLNLSFNKISNIPGFFYHPSNSLMNFYLSNNPLTQLHPRIGLMESIVRLDLRSTKLTELPTTLIRLTNLECLLIDKVTLAFPPMYIVRKGFDEVKRFLKDNQRVYEKEMEENEEFYEGLDDEDEGEKLPKLEFMPSSFGANIGFTGKQTSIENGSRMRSKKAAFRSSHIWIADNLYDNEDEKLKVFFQ